MVPNNSPWIAQLNRTRPIVPLNEDLVADVVIVGGGIAGIMTAYATLRDTDRAVLLIEGGKVAHGATGHNAGQLVSYFERSFSSLVEDFGLSLAAAGARAVEEAWVLLDEVVQEAKLTTPIHRFTGYAGVCLTEQLLEHLEDNHLRVAGGLSPKRIVIAREWEGLAAIPSVYHGLYEEAGHDEVLAVLETTTRKYIAMIAEDKGCSNSALLAEEITGYLIATYPERFRLHEETLVSHVRLHQGRASLTANGHDVSVAHVVLATNGFENFTITNDDGPDINTEFHHEVQGLIGYMAGYVEEGTASPVAISYYGKSNDVRSDDAMGDDYFYLTRRPFEREGDSAQNLICIGGPDKELPELKAYVRTDGCDEGYRDEITEFLASDYKRYPGKETPYAFCWHGLMGYTRNRVRLVGQEPLNPVLYYNLGCNGVGLLPSIMGAARIARLLQGDTLPPSMFDPQHRNISGV
jgi:glycine/D-amino acid oxidase-like deaminating enzyme